MIRLNNVSLPLNYDDNLICKKVCKELKISKDNIENISLFKRSIDARKKNNIQFIATLDINLKSNENNVVNKSRNNNAAITKPYKYELPVCKKLIQRPVIVGFGPAGMFAGLILAQAGAQPIIIEQGFDVDTREKDINEFNLSGKLNVSSNIQFGEGGAGTFSDGKLNTGTKDVRARKVLTEFVNHGAPKEILYNAKPHIGTDYLKIVVKNIRKTILSLGGEVKFGTKLVNIKYKDNKIVGAVVNKDNKEYTIDTDNLILAIGHSSRDTFEMLYSKNIFMEPKAFSVGARIEHLRVNIDKSQYGEFAGNEKLGSAPYKLATHLQNGRGVYTFCMCPGGQVVAAASEENMICTNGMSEFARNSINSNSALLVSVGPNDFNSEHPLAGVEFQRNIEKTAYKLGGGNYIAPVQKVEDFINNKKSCAFGSVVPTYSRGTTFGKLDDYLPSFVSESLRQAIPVLNNYLNGFSCGDALLTGPETRSSSPVRITRNENYQSVSIEGLYPCGEGAGYAGGIISAAVDGIKCAEHILSK